MTVAAEWEHKPKPKVDVPPPVDNTDSDDTVGRSKLMYDLIRLALVRPIPAASSRCSCRTAGRRII